jgi:hypothetical protein
MKTCSKCKIEKPLSDFHNATSGKFGKHHYCKDCWSVHRKQKYKYNPKDYYDRRIRNVYNLTQEQLMSMYHSQNKKCKICGDAYEKVSRHGGLHIDHCHTTGKVRGLLCGRCNTLLGVSKDNVVILQSAIDYLQ